jgi:ribulose-phosphate 3-epimerase
VNLKLGIKSDPIEYRYSHAWLFGLMRELDVSYLQLGSSFEFYQVEDEFFTDMRREAERYGVEIHSCFTAHRELGGFFSGDPRLVRVARRNYERWIEVGALVGASFVGSNPGAVYRDQADAKGCGTELFLRHLNELTHLAKERGLAGLCVEPMSSAFEPPSLPEEIDHYIAVTQAHHAAVPDGTVPVYYCGDISHGIADKNEQVIHTHWELLEQELPHMAEFHFKNTDGLYNSTFGFGPDERERGIIELDDLKEMLSRRAGEVPVDPFIGYLEIGGPKLGRDYSDGRLAAQLTDSIEHIRTVFPEI